jgi:hypothetical protein
LYMSLCLSMEIFCMVKLLDRSLRGLCDPLPISSFRNHAAPRIYRVSFNLGSGPLPLRKTCAAGRGEMPSNTSAQGTVHDRKAGRPGTDSPVPPWRLAVTLTDKGNWVASMESLDCSESLEEVRQILKGHRLDKCDMARY